MRTKILILVAAIILGLIAAVSAAQYINGARERVEAEDQPVDVLIAQQDLPAGMSGEELIDQELLALQTVPRRYVSDGAISSSAAIEGKILTVPLARGEQVTSSRFSLPAAAGLAFAVPEDFVAVALPNTAERGVAGLIRPGDSVAVYATFEPTGELKDAVTKLILRKARVLAVGASTTTVLSTASDEEEEADGSVGSLAGDAGRGGGSGEVAGTVTLALSPGDAEKLVFAQEEGSVWLALLGSGTTEVPATSGQQFPRVIE
jgi:pilus assembly protein CpaB